MACYSTTDMLCSNENKSQSQQQTEDKQCKKT